MPRLRGNALLAGLLLALWPVWHWLVLRTGDGSDTPVGLLALLALFWFGLPRGQSREVGDWKPATFLILGYTVLLPLAPPLLSGVPGMLALACALSARSGRKPGPGLLGLALLSLPLLASLQFYLGYPLRVLVAHLSTLLLLVTGREVTVAGTALSWRSELVSIDAPCSGVQMLWAAAFLLFFLAARERWSFRSTFMVGLSATGVVVVANTLRTVSLFIVATTPLEPLPGFHSALGLVVFALAATAIVTVGRRLGKPEQDTPSRPGRHTWFLSACLLAGVSSLCPSPSPTAPPDDFPGWPDQFEGQPLEKRALTVEEDRFLKGFPGRAGRFTDSRGEVIVRWVATPTRKLHPASDCLRGIGYHIEPGPLLGDPPWSSFQARRDGTTLQVREIIVDSAGRTFPDPSSWYWAALLGRSQGPWWSYTVARRER